MDEKEFFPKGALAFFGTLAVFYASVWLALYATLLGQR